VAVLGQPRPGVQPPSRNTPAQPRPIHHRAAAGNNPAEVGWVGWVGRCRWLPDFDGKARQVSALNYVVQVVAHEHDELAAIPTCCRRVIAGAEHSEQGRCRLAAGDGVNPPLPAASTSKSDFASPGPRPLPFARSPGRRERTETASPCHDDGCRRRGRQGEVGPCPDADQ
jgi:hypothetical protein